MVQFQQQQQEKNVARHGTTTVIVSNVADLNTFAAKQKKNDAADKKYVPKNPLHVHPGIYYSPVTQALYQQYSQLFEKRLQTQGPPQSQILSRSPSHSRISILYKFGSDPLLCELYQDPCNCFRIDKLLEDLDIFAAVTAGLHCEDDDMRTRPSFVVTASVERMVMKKPISLDSDIIITGAVIWVGRSSLEVQIEVSRPYADVTETEESALLIANFLFVAIDPKTRKSAPVNRLVPETEKEKRLQSEAEARDARRRKERERKKAIIQGHVNGDCEESVRILLRESSELISESHVLDKRDKILLKDPRLERGVICQPGHRNIQGHVFGGYLMHCAYEAAVSTCYIFTGQSPCFVAVNHIDFFKAVDVGDFVGFNSCVLYTQLDNPERPLINVEVVSHVIKAKSKRTEVSNRFYFTFTIIDPENLGDGLSIPKVLPATEEEARHMLERMDADHML